MDKFCPPEAPCRRLAERSEAIAPKEAKFIKELHYFQTE